MQELHCEPLEQDGKQQEDFQKRRDYIFPAPGDSGFGYIFLLCVADRQGMALEALTQKLGDDLLPLPYF
jgi:hypothetical protein